MSTFEHGLEFVAYLQGVKAERERIIKLLEGMTHTETDEWNTENDIYLNAQWTTLLALIEGENK